MIYDDPKIIYENPPPPSDYDSECEHIPRFFTYPFPQRHLGPRFLKVDYSLIHEDLLFRKDKDKLQEAVEAKKRREITEDHKSAKDSMESDSDSSVDANVLTEQYKNFMEEISAEKLVQDETLNNMGDKSIVSLKDVPDEFKKKTKVTCNKNNRCIDLNELKNAKKESACVNKSSTQEFIKKEYLREPSELGIDDESESSNEFKKKKQKKVTHDKIYKCIDINELKNAKEVAYANDSLPQDFVIKAQLRKLSESDTDCESVSKSSDKFKKKKQNITLDNIYTCIDLNKLKNAKDKNTFANNSSAQELITKVNSRKLSESDSDHESESEKHKKSKSPFYHRKSKKSIHHKKKKKDSKRTLHSEGVAHDKKSSKPTEFAVKQEIVSSSDEICNPTTLSKAAIPIKNEVLHDEDKNKMKKYNSRSTFDNYKQRCDNDASKGRFIEDDSRNRCYDEDSDFYSKKNLKQELKQEPEYFSGPKEYYCKTCNLNLNSESTYSSHIAGKKHLKVLRQMSEQEVARSSLLEISESRNFSKLTNMDCIELFDDKSKIQDVCDNANILIVGLSHVREIRGPEETRYFCDLCDAQCFPNSIIKHLTGFRHQINCLKVYYPRSYCWVKECDKKDKRAETELKDRLKEVSNRKERGRIRVFVAVNKNTTYPQPLDPNKPGSSQQGLDVQVSKVGELTITDEECLSRSYSDFYCKVCDAHMNNYSMWESHARGKRHAKNKKKSPDGLMTDNHFIEAPSGTTCHLQELLAESSPNEIIVGLDFIRENQGENGDLYNCYLCGSVCPSIDIIPHLQLKKHKAKYLEKMLANGHHNSIQDINVLNIGEYYKAQLIDEQCDKMMQLLGRGRPVIAVPKKVF